MVGLHLLPRIVARTHKKVPTRIAEGRAGAEYYHPDSPFFDPMILLISKGTIIFVAYFFERCEPLRHPLLLRETHACISDSSLNLPNLPIIQNILAIVCIVCSAGFIVSDNMADAYHRG